MQDPLEEYAEGDIPEDYRRAVRNPFETDFGDVDCHLLIYPSQVDGVTENEEIEHVRADVENGVLDIEYEHQERQTMALLLHHDEFVLARYRDLPKTDEDFPGNEAYFVDVNGHAFQKASPDIGYVSINHEGRANALRWLAENGDRLLEEAENRAGDGPEFDPSGARGPVSRGPGVSPAQSPHAEDT